MEAMWVKMAIRLFEREVEEKGDDFEGVERIRLGMQGDLKGVVRAVSFSSFFFFLLVFAL